MRRFGTSCQNCDQESTPLAANRLTRSPATDRMTPSTRSGGRPVAAAATVATIVSAISVHPIHEK